MCCSHDAVVQQYGYFLIDSSCTTMIANERFTPDHSARHLFVVYSIHF